MTPAEEYAAELKRSIEVETQKARALRSALEWADATREDHIRLLVQFELDTLPIADSPPVMVQMLRADLDRASQLVRRAGRFAKKLGAPTVKFAAALAALESATRSLPADFPTVTKETTDASA